MLSYYKVDSVDGKSSIDSGIVEQVFVDYLRDVMDGHSTSSAVDRDDQPKKKFVLLGGLLFYIMRGNSVLDFKCPICFLLFIILEDIRHSSVRETGRNYLVSIFNFVFAVYT